MQLCAQADETQARAVLLINHGQGMVRQLLYGGITAHVTRYCSRPLLVV